MSDPARHFNRTLEKQQYQAKCGRYKVTRRIKILGNRFCKPDEKIVLRWNKNTYVNVRGCAYAPQHGITYLIGEDEQEVSITLQEFGKLLKDRLLVKL